MANVAFSEDEGHLLYVNMNNNVGEKGEKTTENKIRRMLPSAVIIVKYAGFHNENVGN